MGKITYDEAGQISEELINFMGETAFRKMMSSLKNEEKASEPPTDAKA